MANFLYKLLGMFSLTDDYDDDEEYDEDDFQKNNHADSDCAHGNL